MTDVCVQCGRAVDAHDRNVRFMLPDPVLETVRREHTEGTWMSHVDAQTSVMMQVPGIGAFVRALLPVQLDRGHSVTYGVWLAVHPDDLQTISAVWDTPAYADLVIDGILANKVPPWGLLAEPVRAVVRDRRHTPYIDSSEHELFQQVLTETWQHDVVLDPLDPPDPEPPGDHPPHD
jgi:hypothetical protein